MQVSIVEDHDAVAARLERILTVDNYLVQERFADVENAISFYENNQSRIPPLMIVDIGLPGKSGIEFCAFIKGLKPDIKVVMFTVFEEEDKLLAAIENGADGYILKDTDDNLLLNELKSIQLGSMPITPRVAKKILNNFATQHRQPDSEHSLTEREIEVLNYASWGLKYKDIAEELEISQNTVRRHIENIYSKLNVNNRTQALVKARNLGVLEE